MLTLDGESFTTGRSRFFDHRVERLEPTAKIYLKILAGDEGVEVLAQLDTAADWSAIDPEIAEVSGADEGGATIRLSTRFGDFEGQLVRMPITLLADEGESLRVESTVFLSKDWPPGKVFLGYNGFLERVRIALDPQANYFYFGESKANQ